MDTNFTSYTVESIVNALKKKYDLQYNGIDAIKCPTDSPNTKIHPHNCPGVPLNCDLCKSTECKQKLTVFKRNGGLLHTLYFKFMILLRQGSGSYVTGFIREGDSSLETLIKNKFIEKNDLRIVKVAIDRSKNIYVEV